MKNLKAIVKMLKNKRQDTKRGFFIPEVWNSIGYGEFTTNQSRAGEISVNPYDFITCCIEDHILSKSKGKDNLLPLGLKGDSQVNLESCIIYNMFPRMFTAWNHYDDGRLYPGTLLKAICLLPYLKKFNIDIVYLLPIFEHSEMYKKGEVGSPYAIKNVYKIDGNLHDGLLGEYSETIIQTEFKAFVEACHILGIRVMIDFVFRTVARDSDIIAEHPEWFYWIDIKHNDTFCIPYVESQKEITVITEEVVPSIYTCGGISSYLSMFTHNPKEIDGDKWEYIIKRYSESGDNILSLVEQQYGFTTAPAFPPVINDTQPPWSDVTYLRFYFDVHRAAKQFISSEQPPYVLPDIAKASVCSGEVCNADLWDYTENVIPYYQSNFGIDGARVDMGHALPTQLNKDIIRKAKENNPDFIFWSEEFDTGKSYEAKDEGFHFMTGFLWSAFKYIDNNGFYEMITSALLDSILPLTSALETPDTPRAALRYKGEDSLKMMTILGYFVPNAVLMVNNGMEIAEIQPMNLGLENNEQGRFVLDESDPMYGKLAFFDNYRLHWNVVEGKWVQELLTNLSAVRQRFIHLVSRKENFIYQHQFQGDSRAVGFCYFNETAGKCLFVIANRDGQSDLIFNLEMMLPGQIDRSKAINLLYKDDKFCEIRWNFAEEILLHPKGSIIGFIE